MNEKCLRGMMELVDKPGSVSDNHLSGTYVTICLMRPTLTQTRAASCIKRGLYLVLLQMGFALPRVLPPARCALTAPFHPYQNWRFFFCGTFRRFTPPRRYLASCSTEPGLSSAMNSDCLTNSNL